MAPGFENAGLLKEAKAAADYWAPQRGTGTPLKRRRGATCPAGRRRVLAGPWRVCPRRGPETPAAQVPGAATCKPSSARPTGSGVGQLLGRCSSSVSADTPPSAIPVIPRLATPARWDNKPCKRLLSKSTSGRPSLRLPRAPDPLPAATRHASSEQLRDVGMDRIASMDAAGIDVQVMSHVQPAAQGLRRLGQRRHGGPQGPTTPSQGRCARHPDRLAGFATLPTRATRRRRRRELERAASSLGLLGGMIHSTLGTNGAFLDDERLRASPGGLRGPGRAALPAPSTRPQKRGRRPVLRASVPGVAARLATNAWGWHAEAGLHALRLGGKRNLRAPPRG